VLFRSNASWRSQPKKIEVALPFSQMVTVSSEQNSIRIDRRE
jgi:hypothetical protein